VVVLVLVVLVVRYLVEANIVVRRGPVAPVLCGGCTVYLYDVVCVMMMMMMIKQGWKCDRGGDDDMLWEDESSRRLEKLHQTALNQEHRMDEKHRSFARERKLLEKYFGALQPLIIVL